MLVMQSLNGVTSESGDSGLESESSEEGGVRGYCISVSKSESFEGAIENLTRRFRMSNDSVLRSPIAGWINRNESVTRLTNLHGHIPLVC